MYFFDSCVAKILQGGTIVWTTWFILLICCVLAQHLNPESNFLSSVVAGAITGIFETLLMFPIENLKTQQQLTSKFQHSSNSNNINNHNSTGNMSFFQVFKRTLRLQGILGLYRGMGPVLFCAVPNQALRWTAFDTICSMNSCHLAGKDGGSLWDVAVAGIGSGIVVSLITGVPVETAKTLAIHESVVQQQKKLMMIASSSTNSNSSSPERKTQHEATNTSTSLLTGEPMKDDCKQSDREDEEENNNNNNTTKRKRSSTSAEGTFSTLFSKEDDDLGEDSDIDVLEGATIKPVESPVTNSNNSTKTTYKTQDGIVITVVKSESDSLPPLTAATNQNNKSWEEELEDESAEKCKNNGNTGLVGVILSLFNNNKSHHRSPKHTSSTTSNNNNNNNSVLRGWLPTVLKKVGNQGVRFPVHKAALDFLCYQGGKTICNSAGHAASFYQAFLGFLAGAISGIVSIFITQPVDVVKTRMQGLQADRYGHSWSCAVQLLREEGIHVFFHGMGARALRSGLGAGFAFTFFPIVKAMLLAEHEHGHIHH